MLGRQLKLRLVAEEGQDIPRSCTNIVVSIHAIATFQAFNDYLRPRIVSALAAAERLSGSVGGSGRAGSPGGAGTLSSLLAAFAAAAARADAGDDAEDDDDDVEVDSADAGSELVGPAEPDTDTPPAEVDPNPVASSTSTTSKPLGGDTPTPTRRRSSRLSGKGVETPAESAKKDAE